MSKGRQEGDPSGGQREVVGIEVDGLQLLPFRLAYPGDPGQTAEVRKLRLGPLGYLRST